ncbi:MAG: hypothetical protein LQ338_006928 [Usnochroma carphineum]|nr:MAG: hypothetical protein LQ338_006928 [Usnochroma carphineum]
MSSFSRSSPSSRGSATSSSNLAGTGRSSPVRGMTGIARSARGSVKRPNSNAVRSNASSTLPDDTQEADARAEHASLMEELRQRVQKAEALSEDYQRQLKSLQTRLNESSQEHGKLEDHLHEREQKIADMEIQTKQAARQRRELQNDFELERKAILKDQLEQKAVEEELRAVNQRLKDTLTERDLISTKQSLEVDRENVPSSQENDLQENSMEAYEKGKLIETLRLELAESQIKIMELENMGGSRLQELEKTMLETRITNARLMEENESFQLLLSEKTLNGDFTKTEVMQSSTGLGSLAEELESAEGESENYRRLEIEAKSLKDQNKALTVYIENIIGRLLSHKDFENVLEKSPDFMSSIAKPGAENKDKELPPPPPRKDDEPAPSLLQRAKSVVGGARRPRPTSFMASSTAAPPQADNVSTSTDSAPMTRSQSGRQDSHRRSASEMPMAVPIVNQMYRGPPSTGSGAPLSPGISPGSSIARNPFFAPPTTGTASSNTTSRAPSGSRFSQERPGSSSNSTYSDRSGDQSGKERSKSTNYTGAVMTQNRLRPLRLVQENREMESGGSEANKADDTVARKRANRNSWMPGWFGRAKEEERKGNGSENSNFF